MPGTHRGTGKGLLDLSKEHAAREATRRHSVTLAVLKTKFLADPETKKRSKFYFDDLGKHWRRFEEHFGVEDDGDEHHAGGRA